MIESSEQKIRKAAPLVLQALTESKKTRDDDNMLCTNVWRLQGVENEMDFGKFSLMLIEGTVSTPETITRTRRKLQELRKDLRGKLYKVRRENDIKFNNQLSLAFTDMHP